MASSRLRAYAWGLLAYNLAVIGWGAYVRATFSGAGLGNQWPLWDPKALQASGAFKFFVEFSHRASSGLLALLVLGLLIWAFRAFPRKHPARLGATLTAILTITEALLGASLVKFRLVEYNESQLRAVVIALHLCNTFLLIAAMTLSAWWISGGQPIRLRGQGVVGWAVGLALLATLALGMSGALTALADTLFPASSVMEGLRQDLSPTAHFLVRVRAVHPLIAVSAGIFLMFVASVLAYKRPSVPIKRLASGVIVLFLLQVGVGSANMLALTPIWLQISHLAIADLTWIGLVLLGVAAFGEAAPEAVREEEPAPRATVKDYVALTKPRVISLLLLTALATMFIAAHGWPGLGPFLAVLIGGYMAAGAANATNMVIDIDLDGRMRRTSKRPTVTHAVPAGSALLFALYLAVGSFVIMTALANLLSAMLALAGFAFYVVVYSIWLKRRTWHNIVIGGASGAFPPLVGWAAATGQLSPFAWWLFALIFVWTPVHFWALALLIKDDYARAGVPMLPVVRGERATVIQIALYAVLTAVVSLIPLLQGSLGVGYLLVAAGLNVLLLIRSAQLYRQPDRPHAVTMYKLSLAYLAVVFLAMAIERSVRV